MTKRYVLQIQFREAFKMNQVRMGIANIQNSCRTLGIVRIEVVAPQVTMRTLVDPGTDLKETSI
jgi:intracellular sulfur oxidation DsrE/DsrF family protein